MVKPLNESDALSEEKVAGRSLKVKEASSKAKRMLILVRHGQYNLEGQTDAHKYLTDLGREQAALTGKRIKDILAHYAIDSTPVRLTMSSMTRATETGNIILKELDPKIGEGAKSCDLIREGAPAPPDPPLQKNIWDPIPADFHIDGSRIEAAFRKYFHQLSIDILVCHGNVIRYFLCRALQFPPNAWLRMNLDNGSITIFTIHPNGDVVLNTYSNSGHFPMDKKTLT
ncbi:Phosphoglycerate mutase family member 5 [Caligus rogercresseyi]|uniref:Serine/threonine-protein phosphatase PGAM5, mitochondrial n=3 Tax=Caligus rogercresseyi TaxID=217165 RepID=A0A7T8JW21_CALRO|nr:Phosphoglycerate mutase family member 5 [Caligus rogercresseyi]